MRLATGVPAALLAGLTATLSCLAPTRAQPSSPSLPAIPNIAGKVLTVRGPVEPSALGRTLMHEHVFVNFQLAIPDPPNPATAAEMSREKLSLDNLAAVRAGFWNADNDFLGNFNEARLELMDYKAIGGGTVVDVSSIPIGRDPRGLFRISIATGLNVVMGGGWYQKRYFPLNMDRLSVEEMTARIVRDIVEGVDGTGVRMGIIGEIGINGNPLTPNEIKSTRASARAARLTGAPMTFHVGGVGEEKFTVLDVVAAEGVDLQRVVMGHSNSLALDLPLARRVLARGVTIEFDWLGALGSPGGFLGPSDDFKVAKGMAQLIKEGYASQIVISHDICTKLQLRKYGGFGFTYIDDYFLPQLRQLGVSEADIDRIMIGNPARQLAFTAPQRRVTESLRRAGPE
ncbi:MAG: aryldialkylphosphatase [Gammaproteobacteria bacterium]|nr:aryldialkylphosphatase [Gammaproteobacteria bacterium]